MSRKSVTKKETINWYYCEVCEIIINGKNREEHLFSNVSKKSTAGEVTEETSLKNKHTINCPFITNKVFYTTNILVKPIVEELNDLSICQLNNFIFLSESVMRLCKFQLNDSVIITVIDNNDNKLDNSLARQSPIIRYVWPIADAFELNMYVTGEELTNIFLNKMTTKVKIEKLLTDPIPADHVTLSSTFNTDIDEIMWNDLKHVILKQMRDNIYCDGNLIHFEFFNKLYKFNVDKIVGKTVARLNESDEVTSMETLMNNMNITNKSCYYLVTGKTILIFDNKLNPVIEINDSTSDTFNSSKLSIIGGLDEIIEKLSDTIEMALGVKKCSSDFYKMKSLLLYGVPGVGKSLLCDVLTEIFTNKIPNLQVIKFNATDIFSRYFGESETNLQNYFKQAFKYYPRPTLMIIDEIVSICGKDSKENSSKRISTTFSNHLDQLHSNREGRYIFLVTTTSNIENINQSVRRFGRLDIEIEIPIPNPKCRQDILMKYLKRIKHNLTDENVQEIAMNCHGYVGSDLVNLLLKSNVQSMNRQKCDAIEGINLEMIDVKLTYGLVNPSAMKEVLIECPNVKWSDIGGQINLKLQLQQAIEWPILYPEKFLRLGIKPPRGVLMYGPPGCSKTMIAKALATESHVNFLSIKGPELFSMYVGESERAVRDLFRKARQVAPAILFFDEIDAIGSERSIGGGSGSSGGGGSSSGGSSSVKERVLTQLLTEMDGVTSLNNVTIVAATNRPDLIDRALLRPGRIDRLVYVRLPDLNTRIEILKIKSKSIPFEGVDFEKLAVDTDGYSGAELEALCQEAAFKSLEENFNTEKVNWRHMIEALKIVRRRTDKYLLDLYEAFESKH